MSNYDPVNKPYEKLIQNLKTWGDPYQGNGLLTGRRNS